MRENLQDIAKLFAGVLWSVQFENNNRFFYLLQEIYKDRKKFSKAVFEVASSDLVNMGISVVSYTLKDLKDDEVSQK